MKVDTTSDLAWEQYLAGLCFARGYEARSRPDPEADFRVIVTGFGRFGIHARNASGELVSALVDGPGYPFTVRPLRDRIDPPEPQTAVAQGMIELPSGRVSVCAMVLPSFWDLAPLLVLREIAAFEPHLVVMNGIARARHEIHVELGGVNHAKPALDGTELLRPAEALLIPGAAHTRGNLASWDAIHGTLCRLLEARADDLEGAARLGDIIPGVLLARFPRDNTYVCNNTTYTVGYVMDHPHETVRLLEASHPRTREDGGIELRLERDFSSVPRVFMHWPSDLQGAHLRSAAQLLRAVIDAQLATLDTARRGHNDLASASMGHACTDPR